MREDLDLEKRKREMETMNIGNEVHDIVEIWGVYSGIYTRVKNIKSSKTLRAQDTEEE